MLGFVGRIVRWFLRLSFLKGALVAGLVAVLIGVGYFVTRSWSEAMRALLFAPLMALFGVVGYVIVAVLDRLSDA